MATAIVTLPSRDYLNVTCCTFPPVHILIQFSVVVQSALLRFITLQSLHFTLHGTAPLRWGDRLGVSAAVV